jgi:Ca2+-binding RTX toxin-like protein
MADNTIDSPQNMTVTINTTDESWLFTKQATINVTNMDGIFEADTPNDITVLSKVTVSGDTINGINFKGATSSVSIGAKSVIDATDAHAGIQYAGNGGDITVNGSIKGGDFGIHGNVAAVVVNHGSITGNTAIGFDQFGSDITNFKTITGEGTAISSLAAGTHITNHEDATISANDQGILLQGDLGDTSVIDNDGTVKADIAIEDGNDSLTLTNTGKIIGTVILGDGDDVFDTRQGTVTGEIQGNGGDDTFYISNSHTKITEDPGNGTDKVLSTASYVLRGGLDDLTLLGNKDLHGTGSKYDNALNGNKGDNELVGLNGGDTLNGGRGNDTLEGDLGNDVFVFNTGNAKDTVTDFHDGEDLIRSNAVTSQTDFDNLTIKQVGANVVIDFGHGDTLTLQHFDKGDLSYDDFQVVM